MFTKPLEEIIGQCFKKARELRHEYMTTEGLLLSLLNDKTVAKAVSDLEGDIPHLKSDLIKFITETSRLLPEGDDRDTQPTLEFQRVLQRAVYHAQSSGQSEVTPIRTLIAIYGEKDSQAVKLLLDQDINRIDLINYVSHGVHKPRAPTPAETIQKIRVFRRTRAKKTTAAPLRIFISYSHADAPCLDRLLVHLKPIERRSTILCWSDKRIRPGDRWKKEIAENIDGAAVALLLVSADFLASDFVVKHELPPLLIKAEASGTRIIPVIVKPCGFLREETLSSFQSMNDPASPLLGLPLIEQERVYDSIAGEIYNELELRKA